MGGRMGEWVGGWEAGSSRSSEQQHVEEEVESGVANLCLVTCVLMPEWWKPSLLVQVQVRELWAVQEDVQLYFKVQVLYLGILPENKVPPFHVAGSSDTGPQATPMHRPMPTNLQHSKCLRPRDTCFECIWGQLTGEFEPLTLWHAGA